MDFKNYLTKLQNLPDKHKKIIMWIIVAILGIIMAFFWFDLAKKRVSDLGNTIGKIELPKIETPITSTETKNNEIANWKTYKNEEHGFEIKYPNGWYYKEIGEGIVTGGIYFSLYQPDGKDETGGMAFTNESLNISINRTTSLNSLLEFAENYLNLSASTKFEIENIKIDEESGIKIKVDCDGVGCGNPHWFIKKNNNIYIFSSGLSNKNEIDIYNQMILTFKFITVK